MTLILGLLALALAGFVAGGLYNYLSDSPAIDEEAKAETGEESEEERLAVIERHRRQIEEARERERRDSYSEQ